MPVAIKTALIERIDKHVANKGIVAADMASLCCHGKGKEGGERHCNILRNCMVRGKFKGNPRPGSDLAAECNGGEVGERMLLQYAMRRCRQTPVRIADLFSQIAEINSDGISHLPSHVLLNKGNKASHTLSPKTYLSSLRISKAGYLIVAMTIITLDTLCCTVNLSSSKLDEIKPNFKTVHFHPDKNIPKDVLADIDVWFTQGTGIPGDITDIEAIPRTKLIQITSGGS